jgi:chromosome segregation ATPase
MLVTIIAVVLLLAVVAIADQSDDPRQREDTWHRDVAKDKNVMEQLEKFNADLASLKAEQDDIETRMNYLPAKGDALKAQFRDIKARQDQYERAVAAHNMRCPGGESPDRNLVESCNREAREAEPTRIGLDDDLRKWTAKKDALSTEADGIAKEAQENERREKHDRYSVGTLEAAHQRLREEIGQLQQKVLDCAQTLQGRPTCEHIKHECGNIQFDGESHILRDDRGTLCD